MTNNKQEVHALEWTEDSVKILDQHLLPEKIKISEYIQKIESFHSTAVNFFWALDAMRQTAVRCLQ